MTLGEVGFPVRAPGATLRNRAARALEQGKTLRAIEALATIDHIGSIGAAVTQFLLKVCRRRLRAIIASASTRVSEEILSASQGVDDDRPVLWMSDN